MIADGAWQHDLFDAGAAASVLPGATGGFETGTKLYISNLEFGVSQDDVKVSYSRSLFLPHLCCAFEIRVLRFFHSDSFFCSRAGAVF